MQISAICAELMKLDGKFWPGESLNINFSDLDLHFIAADRLQKKKKYLYREISNATNKELNANARHPSEMPKNGLLINPRMHILPSSSS